VATTVQQLRAESFPDLHDELMFPRMSAAKLERLASHGTPRSFAPGDVLYEQGVRDAPFMVIVQGRVRLLDRKPGKDIWIAVADAGTFLGDIATFTGEPAIAECVAEEPTDVIAFDRPELRRMLAAWPEMAEGVLRTMMARREWHERSGHGVMRLIAPRGSRRAFDVRDLLERNLIPVHWYDVDADEESAAMLEWLRIPREETPVLVRTTSVLRNPSAAQVARELGLRAEIDGERFDVVVLGGGPAGLAAAVHGGAEGLRTLVAEA
jgi:thioredoxin reductase (NADPH)